MSHCTNGSKPHSPLRQSVIDYMTLRNLSRKTQQSYLYELDKLSRHYRCSPDQLSAQQLKAYVLSRIDDGLKPRSTNVIIASLRMFYGQVLKRPELIESLVMRRVSDKLPKTVDEAQIKRLIQSVHNIRYRTAVQFAYSTGLRISEVVELQVSDIDSDKCFCHVRNGKGGHERLVHLPQTLLEVLRKYYMQIHPKPQSWLFYGSDISQKLKPATLRHAFNQARGLAGIREDFTFHCLRHSVAAHLLQRGTARDVVQDILGHKSAQSTRVYARTTSVMFNNLDHPANHIAV